MENLFDVAIKKNLEIFQGMTSEEWNQDKGKNYRAAGMTLSLMENRQNDAEIIAELQKIVLDSVRLKVSPRSLRNFYVGLDSSVYWSMPDLAIGNLFFFNQVKSIYAPSCVADVKDRKLMTRHFHIPDHKATLELFSDESDGIKNTETKAIFINKTEYKQYSLNVALYYSNDMFDHDKFIRDVHDALQLLEVCIRRIPKISKSFLYEDLEIIDWYTNALLYQIQSQITSPPTRTPCSW